MHRVAFKDELKLQPLHSDDHFSFQQAEAQINMGWFLEENIHPHENIISGLKCLVFMIHSITAMDKNQPLPIFFSPLDLL